ncbi:hypothetical protein QUB33_26870 [Microcoleus sp. B3-A4]
MLSENKDSLRSIVLGGNSPDADPTGSGVRPLATFKDGGNFWRVRSPMAVMI